MAKGHLKVIEKVPVSYTRRGGDWAQEGGNNTLLVLGTDRSKPDGPATMDDGLGTVDADGGGEGTGTVMLVVGRQDLENGNPDINEDDTTLYLSQKTDADTNLGTTFETEDTGPAAILVTDNIRFVFRNNLKISSAGVETTVFLDGDRLHINMQNKAKISMDITGEDSTVEIESQGNTIKVDSQGIITIDSASQVIVNTEVAEVHATTSALVESPQVTIDADDTTITGNLLVSGDTVLQRTLAVALTAQVMGIASVGGLAPAQGAAIPGNLDMAGGVNAGGDVRAGGSTLLLHTHMVPGIKSGPEAAMSLNIGASAQLSAQIAAAKAAEEAARLAAEAEARRQAEEAAAAAAAEAAAAAAAAAAGEGGGV